MVVIISRSKVCKVVPLLNEVLCHEDVLVSDGVAPRTLNLGLGLFTAGELLVPTGYEAEWAPEPVSTRWCGEKVSAFVLKRHTMNTYRLVEIQLHVFLTSALDESECSASRPGRFIHDTHLTGGWGVPRCRCGHGDKEKN
jgi:hypothetical protein